MILHMPAKISATLFRNISELVTLENASAKAARHIKEEDLSVLSRAAFVEQDGRIAWVGEEDKIPADLAKENLKEVDLGGAPVMPAFVESHTHLVFAGDRADEFEWRNQGQSYQEIAKKGGG